MVKLLPWNKYEQVHKMACDAYTGLESVRMPNILGNLRKDGSSSRHLKAIWAKIKENANVAQNSTKPLFKCSWRRSPLGSGRGRPNDMFCEPSSCRWDISDTSLLKLENGSDPDWLNSPKVVAIAMLSPGFGDTGSGRTPRLSKSETGGICTGGSSLMTSHLLHLAEKAFMAYEKGYKQSFRLLLAAP